MPGLQIRAFKDFSRGGKRIALFGDYTYPNSNKFDLAQPLQMVEGTADDCYKPTPKICELTGEAAQQLMDDIWECGLRPSEGTGSAGSLAATQRHLDDMRKIVFHKLNIKEIVK
jgi:hypothetical protein